MRGYRGITAEAVHAKAFTDLYHILLVSKYGS
jgi:hypothetical protein